MRGYSAVRFYLLTSSHNAELRRDEEQRRQQEALAQIEEARERERQRKIDEALARELAKKEAKPRANTGTAEERELWEQLGGASLEDDRAAEEERRRVWERVGRAQAEEEARRRYANDPDALLSYHAMPDDAKRHMWERAQREQFERTYFVQEPTVSGMLTALSPFTRAEAEQWWCERAGRHLRADAKRARLSRSLLTAVPCAADV